METIAMRLTRTVIAVLALTVVTSCNTSDSGSPGGGSVDVTDKPVVSETTTAATTTAAAPKPAEPAATTKAAAAGLSDGNFSSTAPILKDDGLGDFGGSARVTNTSDKSKTGTFTYTIFKGSEQIATAQGVANTVGPGKTATVSLISQDKYVKGPYRVEFQVDAEF